MSERIYADIVQSAMKTRLNKSQKEAFEKLAEKEAEYDNKLKELEAVKSALSDKALELAKAQAMLEAERVEAAKKIEAFKKQYESYLDMENELNALKKKITTSYTTEDISNYLNKIIRDFNSSSVSDNNIATYVINNMDVDLKVRIYGDEKDSLRFTAPSITETTEDSLSSIKISIQAVPK